MNTELLGQQVSFFIVGMQNGETFPVTMYGFTASRAGDIQRAKWFNDQATALQMVQLLNMFSQLNGDTTTFEGRQQLIEYTLID